MANTYACHATRPIKLGLYELIIILNKLYLILAFGLSGAWATESSGRTNKELESKCKSILQKARQVFKENNKVPYYSFYGKKISKCFKIEPPPLVPIPLKVINPPRAQPATKWHSPICQDWQDTVYTCKYDAVSASHSCVALPDDRRLNTNVVICTRLIDIDQVGKYCSLLKSYEINFSGQKRKSRSEIDETQWFYWYDLSKREWTEKMFDGTNNASKNYYSSQQTTLIDNVCIENYNRMNRHHVTIKLGE